MPHPESGRGTSRPSQSYTGQSNGQAVSTFYIPDSGQPIHLHRPAPKRPLAIRGLRVLIFLCLLCAICVGVPAGIAQLLSGGSPQNPAVAWLSTHDARQPVKVYKMETHAVITMPSNDYLVNVLAAEISPNAPMPALQAVAVVGRTYLSRTLMLGAAGESALARENHANVTDNAVMDLPWWTNRDQTARYGPKSAEDQARLQEAVLTTDGVILEYRGKPILPFLFQLSPGKTRDPSYVLGKVYPYLKPTGCPDDLHDGVWSPPVAFTDSDIAQRLGLPMQSVHWQQLRIDGYDGAGYPISVTDGPHQWTAQDFVNHLGLQSADFRISISGGDVRVKTAGTGNGIGLSVHEATAMASRKETWQQILATFFPGTTPYAVNAVYDKV